MNTCIVLYCIVLEHLYSASHMINPYRSAFLLQLQVAPRKQTGFKKSYREVDKPEERMVMRDVLTHMDLT